MITKYEKKQEVEFIESLKESFTPDPIEIMKLSSSLGFDRRFKSIKSRVLHILKEDEYAREKYFWLLLRFWAEMGYIKVLVTKENLENMISPETVTRACRKLYQEAREGNPELSFLKNNKNEIERRLDAELEYRNYFGELESKGEGK